MSPPEIRRWAGASPDAEHHHRRSAGATHTDQAQDIAPVRGRGDYDLCGGGQ
jgi:hypothetical protein